MAMSCLANILMLALILAGCSAGSPQATTSQSGTANSLTPAATTDAISQATMQRYRVGEIQEYKGMRLDPAIGPRDNSIKGIQTVDISTYKLSIQGLVKNPIQLTYDEVLKLTPYERLITLHCVEGWQATILWKGVRLIDLINQAGGAGETAKTVIFHSVDGYTTSLPLINVQQNELILAYQSNNLPLPPAMGYPFIVVAENKLGYKWARWVNAIELSADENYRGYWEQRGFSNSAGLGE
jgi:DMSO/TMAO reductase YedYZ molybdopterin-dependent catalytic subunit